MSREKGAAASRSARKRRAKMALDGGATDHLLAPADRLFELARLVGASSCDPVSVPDPFLRQRPFEPTAIRFSQIAEQTQCGSDDGFGTILIGKTQMQKDEERVGVRQKDVGCELHQRTPVYMDAAAHLCRLP